MSDPHAFPSTGASAAGVTVRDLVAELTETLKLAGVEAARRTAHDIVTAVLDVPRSWGIGHGDLSLDANVVASARAAAERVPAGAPFGYAVGRAHFRHLSLYVDERVLIPRPETEVLVDTVLRHFRRRFRDGGEWGLAVDIGTGSAAIALSLASEGNFSHVIATDISRDALEVARKNASALLRTLNCTLEFRSGSLLSPLRGVRASLLVSNPPYIAFDEIAALPPSVRDWEPPSALLSASGGLAVTAAIVQEGASLLEPGGMLALEVDERRASLVAEMVMASGNYIHVGVVLDLTGRERFVTASRV